MTIPKLIHIPVFPIKLFNLLQGDDTLSQLTQKTILYVQYNNHQKQNSVTVHLITT